MLIMTYTFSMHIFPENTRGNAPQNGEHISDWFISVLEKYPDIMSRVLAHYIRCVITNPIKDWKTADERIAIGYAAKYDVELYSKCNKSCADIIMETINVDDAVSVQIRSLELIERILQQQTQVEWSLFRHDICTKPREVALIRETIRCLNDKTFSVRRKASQVLILALKQGSPITTRILHECINFVRYGKSDDDKTLSSESTNQQIDHSQEKPGVLSFAYSFEGFEDLEPEFKKMPNIIYQRFLDNNNGLVRCAGIGLIEHLVLINPRIMYDTDFEREISIIAVDSLLSVRKAGLESLDTLLQTYYNCSILIEIYCRVWPCMLNDDDPSLQKLAMHSFNKNVLSNIEPLEYTNGPKPLLPWRILTVLLTMQSREYLQQRLTILLQNENFVTPKLVNTIISHLNTSMSTEAWTLLLLISSRITSNLDSLIADFGCLTSFNIKFNQVLALQLITACLTNFSKAALNQLFKRLLDALGSGSIWLGLVSPSLLLLSHSAKLSLSQAPNDDGTVDNWQWDLFKNVTASIRECINNFENETIRMISLLVTYTEVIMMVPETVDPNIGKFVVDYLKLCTELQEPNFDTDNERIMNCMVVIAGRLALRSHNLALKLSRLYVQILNKNDRPQLINSTLNGMNDLGKKYPFILESNLNCVLVKMRSKYATTRVRTYRCVKDVILAGNIKLKGAILVSLLAGLVDESSEVAHEADAFFIRYQKLYDKLLFNHCLKESPFDLNEQTFLKGAVRVDIRFNSPLKGPSMAKDRRLLYNHIISTLDENTLLSYFGQLKLLAEKTQDNRFIESADAIEVIKDILFIMRRICSCTKAKSQQGGGQANCDQDETMATEDNLLSPTTSEEQPTSSSSANSTPKGRGRNARKTDSSDEPLKQLERCLRYVEEAHRNLQCVMNEDLQLEFDKFCRAMAVRFPNYVDFAQPAEFWKKYKNAKTTKTKSKRRRIDNSDDELDGNSDSDNELPLARHKFLTSIAETTQNEGTFDVLATELIFQPHDW